MRDFGKNQKNSNKKYTKNAGGSNASLLGQKCSYNNEKFTLRYAVCLIKNEKGESKMTREEKVAELERMLAKVPDVMSPLKASKCSPFGRNKVYELIKNKDLRAFVFQGSYIIAKVDLIETIVDYSERKGRCYSIGREVK